MSKLKGKRCCDISAIHVIASMVAILAAIMTNAVHATAILKQPQIKLLINDDELLLQQQQQQQQQLQQLQHAKAQNEQTANMAAAVEAEKLRHLYDSELKRLSYETIHRILRDENEPIYRREDAELRYYQQRSSMQPRHELVRRAAQAMPTLQQQQQVLNLTHNALKSYNAAEQYHGDYALINEIDLSDNQLLTVLHLNKFTHLKTLNLCNNSLTKLPINNNSTLIKLNLNENHIKTIQLIANNQLRYLHLSGNNIVTLAALNLSALHALETLDLSCNFIQNLETAFFPQRMHNLRQLNLAHNHLDSIYRETFYNLLSLNTLLLSHNNISEIDYETFLALPNLQYLDLSHNHLLGSSIRALQGIPDLIGLSIAYNPLVGAAMQEFVASWSLRELDASGTGLCQIPAALAQSVRILKLTDNWLKTINCGDLDSYPLLQYLDLSYSRIEHIEDDALGRLEILEVLFLDHNQLNKIPYSLPTSLEHLFLQYNQIMDIQLQAFQGMNNLKTLDLSGNKLLYLPALPLPKLQTLNLQAAEMKSISQAIVHTLPQLRDLLLEDNPIKCTDLLGIAEWASPCRTEDVGQLKLSVGANIDLKQQYVQMHNFFEQFPSNCGQARQMPATAATAAATASQLEPKPEPEPACVQQRRAAEAAAIVRVTTNSETAMQSAKLQKIVSEQTAATALVAVSTQETAAAATAKMLPNGTGKSVPEVKVNEDTTKISTTTTTATETAIATATTTGTIIAAAQPCDNNTMQQQRQQNELASNKSTNSSQTTKTLPLPTAVNISTTATQTTSLLEKTVPSIPATLSMRATTATVSAKYANHVTIVNETISLHATNRQQPTTKQTTAAATAIKTILMPKPITTQTTASSFTETKALYTSNMGFTDSVFVLNNRPNVSGQAMPTTISTTTKQTAAVASTTNVPQTISTFIKSGSKHPNSAANNDEMHSLLNRTMAATTNLNAQAKTRQWPLGTHSKTNASSLSDTSVAITELATMPAMPTTIAKIHTMEQQPQQPQQLKILPTIKTITTTTTTASKSLPMLLLASHKHEPLQLHIKNRHLIGTPLLMHKGENMLIDAEQLLLPGTATIGDSDYKIKIQDASNTLTMPKQLQTHEQISNAGNANVADILAGSQQQQNIVDKQQLMPEAINVQTTKHYDNTELAAIQNMNNYTTTQTKLGKKKSSSSSLTIKKMTYSTKHATTTSKPISDSNIHLTNLAHRHSSVNTPNAALTHDLNTFAQFKEVEAAIRDLRASSHQLLSSTYAPAVSASMQQQQQQQQQTQSEHWLHARNTNLTAKHPGLMLLLSFGLVVALLVGLINVYRCNLPWRRHTHATRPHHQRQFNDDDAHSFLHYQSGNSAAQLQCIQKWHHSARKEAPYSSPLHNLQVRELQQTTATQLNKSQRCQQFYSASLNATATASSSCSSFNSNGNGINRKHTSGTSPATDETFYIEMTPDAEQHASDLLPMELLSGTAVESDRHVQQKVNMLCAGTTNVGAIDDANSLRNISNKLTPSTRRLGIW